MGAAAVAVAAVYNCCLCYLNLLNHFFNYKNRNEGIRVHLTVDEIIARTSNQFISVVERDSARCQCMKKKS